MSLIRKRKGFTLVELLIVIIILGALSATMMLSSGDSVAAAKANTIVANLSTVKHAALLYWASEPNPTIEGFMKNAKDYIGDTARENATTENATLNTLLDNDEIKSTSWKGGVVMIVGNISYRVWSQLDKDKKENGIWKAQCDFGPEANTQHGVAGDPDRDAIRSKLADMTPDAKLLTEGLMPYDAEHDKSSDGKTEMYKVAIRIK